MGVAITIIGVIAFLGGCVNATWEADNGSYHFKLAKRLVVAGVLLLAIGIELCAHKIY